MATKKKAVVTFKSKSGLQARSHTNMPSRPSKVVPRHDLGRVPISKLLGEFGQSGTKNFSGIITDEYLPNLSFYQAPIVYDQMRRSDGMIAALLASYKMPIRSSKWYVEPADDSEQAVEMADFLHDNLWNFGAQNYDDFLREALSMFDFGFSWFEKVFDWMPDNTRWQGLVGWDRFAFRYQNTRYRWNTEPVVSRTGGIQNRLVTVTQLAPPDYRLIDIPVEKLLIFSRAMEGDNFDGISLLRAVYKHWYIKDALYKIQGIGLERSSMGVPYAKWLAQADDATITQVQNILQNLRVDDMAYATYDGNVVDIGFLQNKFDAQWIAAAIDHHNQMIMEAGLAQFVNLGTKSSSTTGSYALSPAGSELFLTALNGEANTFANDFYNQAILQLIEYNFPNVPREKIPRLVHGDIGQRAVTMMSMALNAFAQYGFVTPDPRTENVLRQILDLPEVDEDWREQQARLPLIRSPTPSPDEEELLRYTKPGTTPTPPSGGPPPGAQKPTPMPKVGQQPGAPKAGDQSLDGKGTSGGQASGSLKSKLTSARTSARPKQGSGPANGSAFGPHTMAEARRLQDAFFAEAASFRDHAITWRPERPSVHIGRVRRPYVVRS